MHWSYTVQDFFYFLKFIMKQNERKSLRREMYVLDFLANRKIVSPNDATCIAQLTMDRHGFTYLCTRLEIVSG